MNCLWNTIPYPTLPQGSGSRSKGSKSERSPSLTVWSVIMVGASVWAWGQFGNLSRLSNLPSMQQSHVGLFVCLFYVLKTSKVIPRWVSTCDSAHSWWLYSAGPLGDQATSTMIWYPTQSHYPDTEPTSPCFILIMPSTRLGSDKYTFLSHWFWVAWVWTQEIQNGRKTLNSFGHLVWSLCSRLSNDPYECEIIKVT